jgi:hypothetical protein
MITTTWINAPADLLGLGGAPVRSGMTVAVAMAPCFASLQGTGAPIGGTPARLREAVRQTGTQQFTHTYIGTKNDGTTLGNHSPGRPQS